MWCICFESQPAVDHRNKDVFQFEINQQEVNELVLKIDAIHAAIAQHSTPTVAAAPKPAATDLVDV